ncbi:MAG TPA: LOG family protein, partial [Flavobacteriales bacterium]|nr:LOG family protein [Flavobacteriales bacterium]
MTPPKSDRAHIDLSFLSGPRSRWKEFKTLLKIAQQFFYGFRKLHFVGPCVTFFGSARYNEGHEYYEATRSIARRVGRVGFTVMTGGGPGLMEAANRGAKDVGATSVGCNIVLPMEQYANPYLDVSLTFDHFFVRKVLLLKYSICFVVMPGGAGTIGPRPEYPHTENDVSAVPPDLNARYGLNPPHSEVVGACREIQPGKTLDMGCCGG